MTGRPMDDDHFHDECGVFGAYNAEEAANLAYLGLHSLQHRGQEAAGIVTGNGQSLFAHRGLGLVQDVFSEQRLQRLQGNLAIGHVRYATAGESHIKNTQPLAVDYAHGSIAVAHNGNLTNAQELRYELEQEGSIFSTTSDTEVLVHLIARSKAATTVDRVCEALSRVRGAYSILFATPDQVIAARDPHGFRPLCLGELSQGESASPEHISSGRALAVHAQPSMATLFASEPPAFELVGGTFVRDLDPGEIVVVDTQGTQSLTPFPKQPSHMCVFEYVYFARPDARLNGIPVYDVRKSLGHQLAEEKPSDVDLVIPVPDSGVAAAMGYAEAIDRPFELGLIRSHYVGRTFIEPQQSIRHFGVRLKLHPVRHLLKGKRVAVIDDSIVRGTTSRKIVKMIRESGAAEVHLRISSPPTRWPCFYGIDTPSRKELIASTHTTDEIARHLTADSVGYLSIEGLHRAVSKNDPKQSHLRVAQASPNPDEPISGKGYCDACFSGNYPVPFEQNTPHRRQLGLVGV